MRIGWVMGWAVPERWFATVVGASWPAAEHRYFPAHSTAVAALEADGAYDLLVGYSLGSLLLLQDFARLRVSRVALLAPILGFAAEENLGGRIARTQVRHLSRWLQRDPAAALADFYRRAGLAIPAGEIPPGSVVELCWGLDRLATTRVEPPLPTGWAGWCGAIDPLLDGNRLQALDHRIRVVPGATHHPADLIAAMRPWAESTPTVPRQVGETSDRP